MSVDTPHNAEAWVVLGLSVALTLISEGVSYLAVYRTADYERASARLVEVSKKLEKEKELVVGADKREKHEKKIQKLEAEFKQTTARTNSLKLKINIFIGLCYLLSYRVISSYFQGRVVAKLPFIPIPLFRRMTLRGLDWQSTAPNLCSFSFIYALSAMALKATIQKALGFAPPRYDIGQVSWAMDDGKKLN